MDSATFQLVDAYFADLLLADDPVLANALTRAENAGLPTIHVSPMQGKLLWLLATLCHARRILEVGTLAGYSTIWLGRALPPDGALVTLEREAHHAAIAQTNLHEAGLTERVRMMVGEATTSLQALIENETEPFDLIFLDADKVNLPIYLAHSVALAHAGTLIIADNVVRNGAVLDTESHDPTIQGVRAFLAAVAAHPRLEAVALQMVGAKEYDGMALIRVV